MKLNFYLTKELEHKQDANPKKISSLYFHLKIFKYSDISKPSSH